MVPLTYLYDEYVDRPKLSEQKKPICVYSSSPNKSGRNKNFLNVTYLVHIIEEQFWAKNFC